MPRQDEAEATIRILGEDLVTGVAKKAEKNVEKVGEAADKARGPFGRLKDKMDEIGKSSVFTELNQGAELASKALRLVGEAWGALKEAAADRAVEQQFQRAFGGAADNLERLERASHGLLADTALERLATQGARAGLSIEQVARLLESAGRAAVGTGKDINETAQVFLKSVIEGNDEATKQNGVLVDLAGAQAAYAQSIGVTAAQLTTAQKAQAGLEEVTRKTNAAFAEVTGDEAVARLARLEAKWEDVKAGVRRAGLAAAVAADEAIDADKRWTDQLSTSMAGIDEEWTQHTNRFLKAEQARLLGPIQAAEAARVAAEAESARMVQVEAAQQTREQALYDEARKSAEARANGHIRDLVLEIEKEGDAAGAAAAHSAELARMADTLGRTSQAGGYWLEGLKALAGAHVSLTENVDLFEHAIAASNSELAKSIALQAKFLESMGFTDAAEAARNAAAGAALAEPGKPKPTGGGGKRGPSDLDKSLADNAKASQAGLEAAYGQVREIAAAGEQAAEDAHQAGIEADNARHAERMQLALDHYEEQKQIVLDSRAAGFDALSESLLGLRDALGEVDGISLDGLASAATKMGPLIDQFKALGDATDSTAGSMASGVLGAVAASGKMVAGIIKDKKAQAVIMALVEQAEAWAAFGHMDYVGFGAHLASSAIWATVAGTSKGGGGGGGSGGGGRASSAASRIPNEQPHDSQSFAPITIHISGGTYLGTDADKTGRELARMVDRHRGRSFRGSDAGGPP